MLSQTTATRRPLKKILGSAFGIAVMVGGIIGVGILRTPGSVAELVSSKGLILLAWTLGGIYIILGVNALAELATMLPKAGGPFNYIQRAFGNYPGFISGWFDFIVNTVAASYFCIAISEYIILLLPSLQGYETILAAGILIGFTALHAAGLKGGSLTQQLTSLVKLLAFAVLIVACFLYGGKTDQQEIVSA
ncbi:MAG TPA: amino acid permease, partial [Chitinophagaceae bacterium]